MNCHISAPILNIGQAHVAETLSLTCLSAYLGLSASHLYGYLVTFMECDLSYMARLPYYLRAAHPGVGVQPLPAAMSMVRLREPEVKVEQQCQHIIAATQSLKDALGTSKDQCSSERMISAHLTLAQEAIAKALQMARVSASSTRAEPNQGEVKPTPTMIERSNTLLAWQASRKAKATARGSQNKRRCARSPDNVQGNPSEGAKM